MTEDDKARVLPLTGNLFDFLSPEDIEAFRSALKPAKYRMSKTIDLPALDRKGILTPLVIEAMKHGATSDHHPDDGDLITLTFAKAADANTFVKAVEAAERAHEAVEADDAAVMAVEPSEALTDASEQE